MSFDEARARKQLEQIMAANGVRSRKLAADIAASVAKQDRSKPLAEILDKAFQDVGASTRMRNIVAPAVVQSVAAGYGVLPSVGWEPSKALQEKAASLRWEGSDMPTLSDRIHGSAQGYRRELEDSLRTSFRHAATVEQTARAIYDGYQPGFAKRGPFAQITPAPGAPRPQLPQAVTDAVDAASVLSPDDKIRLKKCAERVRAYTEQLKDGPLRTSYLELARALESSRAKGLDRAIRVATEEKARYYANRIARTEAARAWGGAFRDRIESDPRVVGIRSRLSSAHKVFDICDFHATADLYKMGPGVYPKDRAPAYPYHAHCTCLLSPVYRQKPSEAPPRPGGPDMDAGARALRGMTDAERRKLLTIPGAKQFQGDPGSWSRTLRQWGDSPKANAAASAAASQLRREIVNEFTQAKSIRDAEEFARAADLADQVNYSGIHLEAANAINRTLHDHLLRFPQLRKNLQFIGTAQERNRLSRKARKAEGWSNAHLNQAIPSVGSNNLASSSDARHKQHEGFTGIAFNEVTFGKNYELWREEWKVSQSGEGKFHPPGKDFVTDVVAHELGHQIDAILGLRADQEVLALWADARARGVRGSISGYAERGGITEGIAEGWAESYGSDAPRSFAKQLQERILTLLGGSQ